MNHIIHNISIILLFFGIILMTHNLTKTYNKCPNPKLNIIEPTKVIQEEPSKMFERLFSKPDIWMGYADADFNNIKK